MILKSRNYVYAGEPLPKITEKDYPAFCLQYQMAILASLKKRGLLTDLQYSQCAAEIESKKNNERRPSYVNRSI